MKDHKNIDELFRERFEQAEVTPPPAAWANIADRLPEKKKKKALIAPLWHKVAGVAALLLLCFTLTFEYFTSSPAPQVLNKTSSTSSIFDEEIVFDSFESQIADASELLQTLIQESNRMEEEVNLLAQKEQSENFSEVLDHSEEIVSELVTNSEKIMYPSLKENISSELDEEKVAASEEIVLDKEEFSKKEEVKESSSKRFSFSTRATPLFGEAGTTDGSGTSFSYGLSLAYHVSEKTSLRTGVNKMDLSYANAGVPFVGQPAGIAEAGAVNLLATPEAKKTEQNANFVEVPLEMEYNLINTKINLKLIGGGSLLFLSETPVLPQGPVFMRDLEQQTAPESFGLTTNFGLGLGYELLQQVEIHVEPMLKFRLNRTNEGLSPYYFGIYSGFSYNF